MRLLLVNANTNAAVTSRLLSLAQGFASAGTDISPKTAQFGVAAVATRAEGLVADAAAIEAVARHEAPFDGVVVAMSYDSAVEALREMTGKPVVGLTSALLSASLITGERLGLVCLGHDLIPRYDEMVRRAGVRHRIAGLSAVEGMAVYAGSQTPGIEAAVSAAALGLVEGAGADAIGLVGAGMAGMAARIGRIRNAPVLDPLGTAVAQVEMLVRLSGVAPDDRATPRPEPAA